MRTLTPADALPLTILRDAFGDEVFLDEGSKDSQPLRILAEFSVDGRQYAVLQSARMNKEAEPALFHIETDEQGELQLATVLDDEEWETILELYDEMTVSFD